MDAAAASNHLFKVVLIGESGVGKSSMLRRLSAGSKTAVLPDDTQPTIGMDTADYTATMPRSGERVRLSIWDTAGQERFRSLTAGYYRNASAVIVVYDVTNAATFAAVPRWLDEASLYGSSASPVVAANCPSPVRVLVGNKIDIALAADNGKNQWREVTVAESRDFARRHDMLWYECSAKCDGPAVRQLFDDVAKAIWSTPAAWYRPAAAAAGNSDTTRLTAKSHESLAVGKDEPSCCW